MCVCAVDCLREMSATVEQHEPMCLVFDPVRGGAPLLDLEAECPAHQHPVIFGPLSAKRDVIIWHRIKDVRSLIFSLSFSTPSDRTHVCFTYTTLTRTGIPSSSPSEPCDTPTSPIRRLPAVPARVA